MWTTDGYSNICFPNAAVPIRKVSRKKYKGMIIWLGRTVFGWKLVWKVAWQGWEWFWQMLLLQ